MENKNEKHKFESLAEKPFMEMEIDGETHRFIPKEDEEWMDNKLQEMDDYIENNDGKGKSEEEKNELYGKAQEIWHELGNKEGGKLATVDFGLILRRDEYNYLKKLLKTKMEYDVNVLFFAIELNSFLTERLDAEGKYKGDTDAVTFPINATDMTYLYTVLSQHKCKGLGKSTFLFANIIRRIGDISKVINYYDQQSKDRSVKIQEWVACFDDRVSKEQPKEKIPDPGVDPDVDMEEGTTNETE